MAKKFLHVLLLVFVPVLFIFDMVIYMTTKSGCLTCGEFTDHFTSNSSLTFMVTHQALQIFKRR